ncbi:hypothetical protein GCM10022289_13020 [Pedobacter jeongneungensis]|uniref:Uncharacterized protein n=1 Tax=Pedobacter jeongneungensis TaxID=947309 RepID=A0ABP8B8H0_9SPHI
MSSDRLRTQINFEHILSGNNEAVWLSLTKGQIKSFIFNATHVALFESAMLDDCLDFYYKGIISLNEGIIATNKKNFSWATVKLYYSVYYLLRCSLCCNRLGFVRKERDGYYFENNISHKPIALGKPDHMAAIDLFKNYFAATDFLQSNNINGTNPYEWLRHQRENINYRYRTFFEPDIPIMWETISQECDNGSLDFWIERYISDDIYSFLDDHAVLALPIRRLMLTHADLISKGFAITVKPEKLIKLNQFIAENDYLKRLRPYYRGA